MDQRQPLFRLFFVFSNKQHNFYIKSMWKMSKCPSCIQHRDSNPRSFEHESSPITTRPGLPPFQEMLMNKFNNNFGFNKSSLDIFRLSNKKRYEIKFKMNSIKFFCFCRLFPGFFKPSYRSYARWLFKKQKESSDTINFHFSFTVNLEDSMFIK